jgi:hypothetical protein
MKKIAIKKIKIDRVVVPLPSGHPSGKRTGCK